MKVKALISCTNCLMLSASKFVMSILITIENGQGASYGTCSQQDCITVVRGRCNKPKKRSLHTAEHEV